MESEKRANASDIPKSTDTQSESMKGILRATGTMGTQGKLFQNDFQISTSCVQDSLAKVSRLLGKEGDLKILAEPCFMKLRELPRLKDLSYCSWKTSRDFCHTIKGEPLELSSQPFLTWGMLSNGRYLTARISEFRKTGRGCSLSDILEESPDGRYFLSKQIANQILRGDVSLRDMGESHPGRQALILKRRTKADGQDIKEKEKLADVEDKVGKRNRKTSDGTQGALFEGASEGNVGQPGFREQDEKNSSVHRRMLLARMPGALQKAEDEQEILGSEDREQQRKGQESDKRVEKGGMDGVEDMGARPKAIQFKFGEKREWGICPTLKATEAKETYVEKKIIIEGYIGGKSKNVERESNAVLNPKGIMMTLTAQGGGNTSGRAILDGSSIRRLTPTECERLQGFPDGWTEGISDTQRYKCLGNAVTTNVIRAIVERMI